MRPMRDVGGVHDARVVSVVGIFLYFLHALH